MTQQRLRPTPRSLTIIIPAYNEVDTIEECIRRVIEAPKLDLDFDIVISDNVSTDGTREILERLDDRRIKVVLRDSILVRERIFVVRSNTPGATSFFGRTPTSNTTLVITLMYWNLSLSPTPMSSMAQD